MHKQEIVNKLVEKPSYFKKGSEYLATYFGTNTDTIVEAKKEARSQLNTGSGELSDVKSDGRSEMLTATFNKEASPQDIDNIAKVDNVTSFVTNYWLKSHNSGNWTYSIQVKRVAKGIDKNTLEQAIKSIIPNLKPKKLPVVSSPSEEVCMIYISDIHAGAQNSEHNIHGASYNKEDLEKRLNTVLTKVLSLGKKFNTCIVVNLGDSVDGWDGFTLRKTHHLGSLSNKDQFNIYFECMCNFYTTLFESGLAKEYGVWNCLDDNHAGIQFSYICNKAVQNTISLIYPSVQFYQQDKFIDTIEIGNHVFAFTHGKDGFMMKYPMKAILDDRIDIWAYQYFDTQGYKDKWKHIIKGDLHLYNVQYGKFGRYVNIPSIYGTSDYISLNYGLSRPGAAIEIINPLVEETWLTPVWL